MRVRRAFLWATFGRYLVMLINLAVAIVVARLIGPAAFGISVLGSSAFVIAEALRELGGGAYLVQQKELTLKKIRTSITTSALVSIAISFCLYFAAAPIAHFYGLPEVGPYIEVAAIGYLLGPFIFPAFALMSREMAFASFSLVNTSMSVVGGLTGICLAKFGFGYISLAWATVASAVVGSVLCFCLLPDRSIYLPSLGEWRGVLGFGTFDSAAALIAAVGEYAAYLVIGRALDSASVGIAQRAVLLSAFPERVILAGVGAVALPVFSKSAREKSDTKTIYLNALELITAAHWPCLILLSVLAAPLVRLLLGPQWLEVAPLVSVLCVGAAFSFTWSLQYPVLVALGAVRSLPLLLAGQAMLNIAAVALGAGHGLLAIAWCLVGVVPLRALIAIAVVRQYLPFSWAELFVALRKSAALAIFSALGPICLLMTHGGSEGLSMEAGVFSVLLVAAGWSVGLALTRHPIRHELVRAVMMLKRSLEGRLSRIN